MQINITVDGLDGVDLNTVVGDEIAYYNPETEETEYRPRTLADIVASRLVKKLTVDDAWSGLRNRYLQIRDEEIRDAVKPLVAEAITGAIEQTNAFGERTGQTTTMRELVMVEANKTLTGRGPYGQGKTLAQSIVADAVGAALRKELSGAIAAEKAKVVAAVQAKAAELIADAVKQGVGR